MYRCICTCVHAYMQVYFCMHVRMSVALSVCVCSHICTRFCMYVCMYVCIDHACMLCLTMCKLGLADLDGSDGGRVSGRKGGRRRVENLSKRQALMVSVCASHATSKSPNRTCFQIRRYELRSYPCSCSRPHARA